MSAVKKTAKVTLVVFGLLVFLVVGLGAYLYVNMDSIAKNFAEQAASKALGVPVTIGDMDIILDQKKVVVSDIAVANPQGYKNEYAITIKNISVAGESFSSDLLSFALISVDGTAINLEVNEHGANLGALKKQTDKKAQSGSSQNSEPGSSEKASKVKVIVKRFSLTGAELTPSVTLLENANLPVVKVPDIHIKDIGEKENGVPVEEAIAQIMAVVLGEFNKTANSAGFMDGMSLEMLNEIGISTGEVFKKNLKKSYKNEVNKFKNGLDGLKNMFE